MNRGREQNAHAGELMQLQLLIFLRMEKMVGRYRLKELLSIPQHEGIVRRMLRELAEKGWVSPTRSGSVLTSGGYASIEDSLQKKGIVEVKEVDLQKMGVGPKSVAVQVRQRECPCSLLSLRDEAVKAGASGAVILIHENGDLNVPLVYRSLMDRYPAILSDLETRFTLVDRDMIVIGFAETASKALTGALAIVMAIDRERNEHIT